MDRERGAIMLILLHAGVAGHVHATDAGVYVAMIAAGTLSIWLQWHDRVRK
jgi:hypothetical protein